MPRKYRPPVAKRRKSRKSPIPYDAEPSPGQSGEPEALDASDDGDAPLVAVDVAEPPPEPEDRPVRGISRGESERHTTRDYSYVRGEVLRIAAIAGFIVTALIVVAILR